MNEITASVIASGGIRNQKGKKKKGQQQATVPTFNLPYSQSWPIINKIYEKIIIEEIEREFKDLFGDQWLLKKKNRLKKKWPEASEEELNNILLELAQKHGKYVSDPNEILETLKQKKESPYKSIVVGINNISKILEKEKGTLDLILVCCSAQPQLMTTHLLCQSALLNIPACALNGLSETLAPLLQLKSALAVAFKHIDGNPLERLIEFIKDKVKNDEENSWLKLWKSSTTRVGSTLDDQTTKNRQARENVKLNDANIVWKKKKRKIEKVE